MQPYYFEADSLLHRLNPLSKVLATLPAIVFLALTTTIWPPLCFLALTAGMTLLLGRIPLGRFLRVALPLGLLCIGFLLVYPLVVRRELVQHSPVLFTIGALPIYRDGVLFGLATALRIYALILLSLPFSLTTDAGDFVRALIQQARVPYRIGFSAMAAFRFVPLLQSELRVIQAAHRVRGVSDRSGPRAQLDRARRYAVPLLATAIRQAERTALAMDGRAFGASASRTYRRRIPVTYRDWLFVGGVWLISAAIIAALARAGLLGPLVLLQTV